MKTDKKQKTKIKDKEKRDLKTNLHTEQQAGIKS